MTQTIKMPKGIKRPDGKVKIAVVIDSEVFEAVIHNGKKQKLNFSDSLNDVAKCGLLCLSESDAMEPNKCTD